jgi:hypothetical protein
MQFYEYMKTGDEMKMVVRLVTSTSGVYFLLWFAGAVWDRSTTAFS